MKFKIITLAILSAMLHYGSSPSENEIPLKNYCSINGEEQPKSVEMHFKPGRLAQNSIDTLLQFIPVSKRNMTFRSAAVEKAIAVLHQKRRFVFFDALYMAKIRKSNSRWSVYFVLAHELAHHLNADMLEEGTKRHQVELEADKFAGQVLGMMGAPQEEVIKIIETFETEATTTHPAAKYRGQVAMIGWEEGQYIYLKEFEEKWDDPYLMENENCKRNQIGTIKVKNESNYKITLSLYPIDKSYYDGKAIYNFSINPNTEKVIKDIPIRDYNATFKAHPALSSSFAKILTEESVRLKSCMVHPFVIKPFRI